MNHASLSRRSEDERRSLDRPCSGATQGSAPARRRTSNGRDRLTREISDLCLHRRVLQAGAAPHALTQARQTIHSRRRKSAMSGIVAAGATCRGRLALGTSSKPERFLSISLGRGRPPGSLYASRKAKRERVLHKYHAAKSDRRQESSRQLVDGLGSCYRRLRVDLADDLHCPWRHLRHREELQLTRSGT